MYHSSGEINSQSVTHQCVTHRLLVISQSAPFRRLPRYERDGERGRERTETNKDGGREGRMDIWIEGKTKRSCFLIQKTYFCSYGHMFIFRNHCI